MDGDGAVREGQCQEAPISAEVQGQHGRIQVGQHACAAQAVHVPDADAGIVSCHGQSPAGHRETTRLWILGSINLEQP